MKEPNTCYSLEWCKSGKYTHYSCEENKDDRNLRCHLSQEMKEILQYLKYIPYGHCVFVEVLAMCAYMHTWVSG